MTKNVGTQTDNTIFELLDHDYSLYHTDYSKNLIFELKIKEYSTQIQEFKKEKCSLNTTAQELKIKNFYQKKSKMTLMLYVFILVLKIMMP